MHLWVLVADFVPSLQVPECDDMLLEWMREMAAYLKTLDPNHLITSGGEGFFGANSQRANANPQVRTSCYSESAACIHLHPALRPVCRGCRQFTTMQSRVCSCHLAASSAGVKPADHSHCCLRRLSATGRS